MFRMCPAVAVVDDDEADDLACHSVGKFCGQRSNNNIAKYNTCGDPFLVRLWWPSQPPFNSYWYLPCAVFITAHVNVKHKPPPPPLLLKYLMELLVFPVSVCVCVWLIRKWGDSCSRNARRLSRILSLSMGYILVFMGSYVLYFSFIIESKTIFSYVVFHRYFEYYEFH